MGQPCAPEIAFAARAYAAGAGVKCGGPARVKASRSALERLLLAVAFEGLSVRRAAEREKVSPTKAYRHWARFAEVIGVSAVDGQIGMGVAYAIADRVKRRARHPAVCRPRAEIADHIAATRTDRHEHEQNEAPPPMEYYCVPDDDLAAV